jgi:hypothetical protein
VIRLDYSRPDDVFSPRSVAASLRTPAARRAINAFGTAAAFVILLWGTEVFRLNAANDRLQSLEARYDVVAIQRKQTEALVARLGVLTLLQSEVADVRLSGDNRVAEIVDVANHLPPTVFLESLQPSANGWRLAGHATSIDQVGKAVVLLEKMQGLGVPRLRQVRSDKGSNVEYELDLDRGAAK